MKKLNSLTKHKAFNYLEDPLLSAYFLSKEAKAYYISLKHVDTKRDYHAQLISSIKDFLSLADKANVDILNFYVFSKSDNKSLEITNSNSSITLENIHPQGCELLEMKSPLTFQSLKKCYRKAVMKYHPDRGGDHENMLIINEAYTVYQDYLCGNLISPESPLMQESGNNFRTVPRDANDYIYLLNSLLTQVYCDEWDLTNSYQTVKNLQKHNFYDSKLIQTGEEIYKVVTMASALTKRLAFANRNTEANEMMDFTKYIYQIGNLSYKPYIEEPANIINGIKALRVVLNHRRQADNALAHNIITNKKYAELLKKFEANKKVSIDKEIILEEYLNTCGFNQELSYDTGATRIPSNSINIPEVHYFEDNKLHSLSTDQQGEYFLAFSKKSSVSLVRKYTYVRLASYILSIKSSSNENLIDNIFNECVLLGEIFNTPHRKDSRTMQLVTQLSIDISRFKYLSKVERAKKIKTFRKKYRVIIRNVND